MSNTDFKPSDELVTMLQPDSAASEAFRTLRTNLSLRDFDQELKVINIISAVARESKSTTILNLGYTYSLLKKKVLIIDLDLRLSSLHKKLKIKNTQGVTDVVAKKCSFEEAVIHYTIDYDILLSGTKTPFSVEFVQSQAFKDFLQECRNKYDIVLIDCPPINVVADGMIVSTYCDGTIFCVGSNKSERKDLEYAREQLKQFNVNVLGIVMTRMPVSKKYYSYDSKYGYGYGKYGYGYGYRSNYSSAYKNQEEDSSQD